MRADIVFQVVLVVKQPPTKAGDTGSIPGWGRSLGGGNGNLFQYSCLENPMDREAWRATVHRVTKSQSRLNTHACRRQPQHWHRVQQADEIKTKKTTQKGAFHPRCLSSTTQPSVPCRQTSLPHPHSPDTAPNWPSSDPTTTLTFYVSGALHSFTTLFSTLAAHFSCTCILETSMGSSSCSPLPFLASIFWQVSSLPG